jgi:hypothetical protein
MIFKYVMDGKELNKSTFTKSFDENKFYLVESSDISITEISDEYVMKVFK